MSAAGIVFSVIVFLIMISLPFLFQNILYSTNSGAVVNQFNSFFEIIGWPFWVLISAAVAVGTYIGVSRVS